jgi:hypothetical protein
LVLIGSKYTLSFFDFDFLHKYCGISIGVAKKAVRDWMKGNHKKYWESTTGLKQANGLISGPSAKRTKDLLNVNRDQLRWMVDYLFDTAT